MRLHCVLRLLTSSHADTTTSNNTLHTTSHNYTPSITIYAQWFGHYNTWATTRSAQKRTIKYDHWVVLTVSIQRLYLSNFATGQIGVQCNFRSLLAFTERTAWLCVACGSYFTVTCYRTVTRIWCGVQLYNNNTVYWLWQLKAGLVPRTRCTLRQTTRPWHQYCSSSYRSLSLMYRQPIPFQSP
jgi:hypothetical protein